MESLVSLPSPCLLRTPSPSPPKTLKPTIPSPPLFHYRRRRRHHLRRRRVPAPATTTVLRSHGLSSAPSPALSDASDPFDIDGGDGGDAKFDWYAQWYPVAPLCDLDKRAPHAKTVMGLDVVAWWDRGEGRWRVFDDRCPHRLAPLSEGRIDPRGRLQCVYHGWCFDGSGRCNYIPQAPSSGPQVHLNSKACAAVYPSIEQNKVLWFWPSTDPQYKDILEKKRPPYVEELDDPTYTCTMGIRELQYGYEVLMENLMDPAHVPYAHRGIIKVRRRVDPGRYVTLIFVLLFSGLNLVSYCIGLKAESDQEGGGHIDMTIAESSESGFLANLEFGYFKFAAPCLLYGAGTVNQSATSRNVQENTAAQPQQRPKRTLVIFMCIPVSPGRSRLIFAFQRNFAVWIDRFVRRWMYHLDINLVLDSDLYLLHAEERNIAKSGFSNWYKACYVPTKSDAMVTAFRNWLRKYSNNQVDWGNMSSEQLPPTPPREQLMNRYWTHVVQCTSCRAALKGLKALEFSLQVLSLALIGVVAAAKHSLAPAPARNSAVLAAVLCFVASRWLAHFIYKNFYFHDYNHVFNAHSRKSFPSQNKESATFF